jgi:acyl-CoA synthetase (AMP-forming)/AMP-acid ligase II/thioesterase domain-containing protein
MSASPEPVTLVELLGAAAVRAPGATALVAPGRPPLTYAELVDQAGRTAAALRDAGAARDDVVALVVDNGPEAASAFLALAGASVCAPLNPAYREAELDFYLGDLGARLVVVGRGTASPVREVAASHGIDVLELEPDLSAGAGAFVLAGTHAPAGRPEAGPAPDDVALMLHTSGTTSRPKLVPLTHRNLCASAANVASVLELRASDRCLNVMPLFHIHGLVAALLASLRSGGSVACTPGFHAVNVFGWARELHPTWLTAVPTMLQAILARVGDEQAALAGLRFVRSSSSALPVPVLEGLERALGVPVLEAYGMTEAAHQMASNRLPPAERLPGSVGAAAGPEIAILDEHGAELPAGSIGEVAIRGVNVFAGYTANPEANAAAFTNGWFRTGDGGRLDERGGLRLSGRLKEIINRAGEKIAPAEIEDILLRHPAVAQAVTFAIPDSRLGEEVGAAVVLVERDGAGERELQDFVAQTVAPFKVPRTILLVDEIPKGATGKLQRIGLHERLGVGPPQSDPGGAAAANVPPRTYPERLVARVWCEVLDHPRIGVHDDFFALGGDSILGAEAVARIRDLTGRDDLPLVSIVRAPTVASFALELEHGVERPDSSLVAIQESGEGLPLYLVHGVDGDVLGFAALARRLGEERPFYGLRARAVEGGALVHGSIEEMADAYLGEVTRVQPAGPYLIGGLCAGGPVAIEMARQLRERGEAVAQVVLIDPRLQPERTPSFYAWRLRSARRRGQLGPVVAGRLRRLTRGPRAAGAATADEAGIDVRIAALRDAYVLRPLDVRAALLISEDYDGLGVPASVWGKALRGVRQYRFAGAHEHLFLPPAVDHLAATLRAALAEADA